MTFTPTMSRLSKSKIEYLQRELDLCRRMRIRHLGTKLECYWLGAMNALTSVMVVLRVPVPPNKREIQTK